jgi:hypothetical protein
MIDNSKLNINTPLKIKKYKGSLMNIPSYMKISQFIQNILGEGECKHKDRDIPYGSKLIGWWGCRHMDGQTWYHKSSTAKHIC